MTGRRKPTVFCTILCAVCGLTFAPRLARAQITLATINGTVTDSSGAVVPDAEVTILNEGTNAPLVTKTDSDGSFVAAQIQVGTYTVTVTKQGFATYTEKSIKTSPGQVTSVYPVLGVGTVSAQVQVSASAVQVQTATAEVSNQVSEREVNTLPLNGRNFQSLSALMPGVTNLAPDTAQVQGGFLQVNTMSVNGMALTGTMYYVDGIWDMNTGDMLQLTITPNPDSLEEVRVLQNNYSSQYALFGANVALLHTKSGTAQFHGSAFEYLRNDDLDARNFFSPTVPPLKQNIFGFTLGGPIFIPNHFNTDKKKLFFFWSEQWARQNIGLPATGGGTGLNLIGASPTEAMRNGTFNTPITDPTTGQPFPQTSPGIYQIPTSSLNPNSLVFMNTLANLPNIPGNGFFNYINLNEEINRTRDDEGKIDVNFSEKLRLVAEYLDDRQTNDNPNSNFLPSPYSINRSAVTTANQLAQLQLTWVPSPSMVNTTAVNMNNYVVNLLATGIYNKSQIPDFQSELPYSGFLSERLPQVMFAGGWSAFGQSQNTPSPHSSNLNDTLIDDFSWLKGNHNIQAGFALSFGTSRENTFSASNGSWFFSGQFTGNPIADYLLGDAATFAQASTVLRAYNHDKIFSPYVQDRWKVNRKLTITAGIRYEFLTAPTVQSGYATNFVPSKYSPAQAPIVNPNGTITITPNYNPLNGLVTNGQNGVPQNFTTTHQNAWLPTVGFAYDVHGDGKTSVRGGFSVTQSSVPTSTDCSLNCTGNPPAITTLTLVTPPFPSPIGAAPAPPGASPLVAQDTNFYPRTTVLTYSLSVQHQFKGNWLLSVAYAGNGTHHLQGMVNINQPPPDAPYNFNPLINSGTVFPNLYSQFQGYGNISQSTNPLTQRWNALEIGLRHPMGHNLYLTSAYTWQHCLSDGRGNNFTVGVGVQDSFHPLGSYGTCTTNAYNVWATSVIWTLPWLQGAQGAKKVLLGGWQFADITTIQSGFALDPGIATSNPGLATRPDRVSGSSTSGAHTVNNWFNTNAFSNPAPGFFGNSATGSIIGPGVFNFDMALYKDFPIKERASFQFRVEAFNIFNHTNFSGVQTAYGAGNFGQVTSALDPRIFEFALRFQF